MVQQVLWHTEVAGFPRWFSEPLHKNKEADQNHPRKLEGSKSMIYAPFL